MILARSNQASLAFEALTRRLLLCSDRTLLRCAYKGVHTFLLVLFSLDVHNPLSHLPARCPRWRTPPTLFSSSLLPYRLPRVLEPASPTSFSQTPSALHSSLQPGTTQNPSRFRVVVRILTFPLLSDPIGVHSFLVEQQSNNTLSSAGFSREDAVRRVSSSHQPTSARNHFCECCILVCQLAQGMIS